MEFFIIVAILFAIVMTLRPRGKTSNFETVEIAPESQSEALQPNHFIPAKTKARSSIETQKLIAQFPVARAAFVVDGDTVDLLVGRDRLRVRLDSIDCPEDGQTWGEISRYGLIKLIGKRRVHLEIHGLDDYRRTLATLYTRNSDVEEWVNVNERMVTLGHAWVMRRYYDHLPEDRQAKLNRLEAWARSRRVGLWRDPNPIPPWLWRRSANLGATAPEPGFRAGGAKDIRADDQRA